MKNRMQKAVWLYRIIVEALGLTSMASVVGTIALAMSGQSTPEVLVALGSAATARPAGCLVPSHLNH